MSVASCGCDRQACWLMLSSKQCLGAARPIKSQNNASATPCILHFGPMHKTGAGSLYLPERLRQPGKGCFQQQLLAAILSRQPLQLLLRARQPAQADVQRGAAGCLRTAPHSNPHVVEAPMHQLLHRDGAPAAWRPETSSLGSARMSSTAVTGSCSDARAPAARRGSTCSMAVATTQSALQCQLENHLTTRSCGSAHA